MVNSPGTPVLTPDAGRRWRAFRPNLSATLVLHESTGFESTLLGPKCAGRGRLQKESWFGSPRSLVSQPLESDISSLSLARDNTNIPQWQLSAGH